MSDISEVSKAIGRLEATQEQHGKAHQLIMEKLDTLVDTQRDLSASISPIKKDAKEALEHGRDWKKSKSKVIGFALGISAATGTLASQIKDFLS